MMSSNPKAARSRFSSPLHLSSSPSSHNRGVVTDGQRGFMQRWLEPPVQNKASFQEAGLMRGGVVENMAPLGTLPKAAMLKKGAVGEHQPVLHTVKRIVLKKSSATATPPENTPMSTAAESTDVDVDADVDVDESAPEAPLSPLSRPMFSIPIMDDREDEDYVPKKSKARHHYHHHNNNNNNNHPNHNNHNNHHNNNNNSNSNNQDISHNATVTAAATPSTRRHSSRRKSARTSPTPNPAPASLAAAEPAPVHSSSPFHPPPATLSREPDDKELADKVVEAAVDEALRHYRYPTAWALRLLYDENSSDPHFVSMIEDIYYQRADVETLQEFGRLIHEKKKDGKRDNKGCYYFVPPSTGSRFTPHKPKPAPYHELVTMDLATPLKELDDGSGSGGGGGVVDVDGHVSKKVKIERDRSVILKPGTNGQAHGRSSNKSPRGKKTRSGSVSSTSSLSSVPDDVIEDFEEFMDRVDGDLGVSRPMDAEQNNAQIPVGSTQPISATQKKPAAKKKNASPNSVPSHTTTTPSHHPPSRDSSMPAAIITNGASHHQSHSHPPQAALKFNSRFGSLSSDGLDGFSRKKLSKKSENTAITKDSCRESFIREPLPFEDLLDGPPPPPPEFASSSSRPPALATPALTSRAARAARRNHDDLDESASPTTSSFRADQEPASARNSRAATPSNVRSAKKPRGGLRVKTSPMKKKGTSAGIPRNSGERPSPVGNGGPNNQAEQPTGLNPKVGPVAISPFPVLPNLRDDNDDSCYTCGGNGRLVCCDGCNYSFHFLCIDPPMDEGHEPDEWFCNECSQRFYPSMAEYEGAFDQLFSNLERKNPRAFRLPEDIREYFEGVKTGQEGEYEDIPQAKPKTGKKHIDEPFDFFKIRNAEGAVLCHHCNKAAADNQPIIPCSVCGLNWHLECLDPPLAVPPVPRTWRCPCHVDDILSDLPARLGPAHKYRKVKNAPPIRQSFSRGMANNGWIEIDEDDEDEEPDTDWREQRGFGRVFRLSATGIKKDFITRVHQNRERTQTPAGITNPAPAPAVPPRQYTLEEQQAALNLSRLAQGGPDRVGQLVQVLLSEASPGAKSIIANLDADRIASGSLATADITTLQALLAQTNALSKGISTVLEYRTKSSFNTSANVGMAPSSNEQKALTPESTSPDDAQLDIITKSPHSSPKTSEADVATATLEESAMEVD
ncbi:hypothetical protein F4809DRAFT_336163 [Biscogniauxia mediterranea]|nr:hypothetical protein F4809DRAFT_336163 [Biscogniauxia mediterranea]